MDTRKELQHLLRKGKKEKPYTHASHIIRYSVDDGVTTDFVTCLSDQIEMAFNFLMEKKANFIIINELGKVAMSYNR
ncbi:hypothetical protein PP175_26755 (plasmid) [Aneurinibacillus sp. Ricciae_BoGa-3]|uniref:hypothetical protein n=1 Tax=Aneurinibacillus sp. Ricciae_BoGa-3 TaxID=3022697 RepID=UPI00234119B3|nr:hypothetical protein [Aneurinibacillus sp. Ricciae_BoGa-3]WCK57639.1 hypothetical protein PP175_26755 [Aneurinibacillus sp. Ricciae_BoGa-3]